MLQTEQVCRGSGNTSPLLSPAQASAAAEAAKRYEEVGEDEAMQCGVCFGEGQPPPPPRTLTITMSLPRFVDL